jgi:hypothetical protein
LAVKIIIKILVILVGIIIFYEAIHLIWLRDVNGWALLSWAEEVAENGPSTRAAPEDVGSFGQVKSFNGEKSLPLVDIITLSSLASTVIAAWMLWARKTKPLRRGLWRKGFWAGLAAFLVVTSLALSGLFSKHVEISDQSWAEIMSDLKVGDVIAYRKEKWSARRELFAEGKFPVIGYRLFRYGHLGIVVDDPGVPGRKALFTSQSQKGVNMEEDIDTLRTHNWDAWRLDKWHRVDHERIREGILRCQEKGGHFFGYDFTGMFALWNENLKPEQVEDFGNEYICSTAVVTLLYYGGFESDATPRQGMDLITPYQVVRARGRFVKPPDLPKKD